MFERFFPDEYLESTYKIDFEEQYRKGYRGIIFDIDNTLYDYDSAHLSGMKALTAYCIKEFKISEKQVLSCYDKAMKIMSERIGTDSAAIHSRMLRFQCMTELLSQPLFPHVENMYHAYWDTIIANAEISTGILKVLED